MALRRPLVINGVGETSQLPLTDLLEKASLFSFDNSTNGFTSTQVQAAIEEARYSDTRQKVSATSLQQRTANTFTLLNSMTLNIAQAGTYEVIFNCWADTEGVNGEGEFVILANGSQVADSIRPIKSELFLLGLITISTMLIGVPITIVTEVTVAAGQNIEVHWRSVDGQNIRVQGRFLRAKRVA